MRTFLTPTFHIDVKNVLIYDTWIGNKVNSASQMWPFDPVRPHLPLVHPIHIWEVVSTHFQPKCYSN